VTQINESIWLDLFTAGAISFGLAYYLLKKLNQYFELKSQRALANFAMISFGFSVYQTLNELIVYPMQGLATNYSRLSDHIIYGMLSIPAIMLGVAKLIGLRKSGATKSESFAAKTKRVFSNSSHSEQFYSEALDEYESRRRKRGLYARLYSQYKGDESLVKAEYLKVRVNELSSASVKLQDSYKTAPRHLPIGNSNSDEFKSPLSLLIGSQAFMWTVIVTVVLAVSWYFVEGGGRFGWHGRLPSEVPLQGYDVHISDGKTPCNYRKTGIKISFAPNATNHKVIVNTSDASGSDTRTLTLEECVVTDRQHWLCFVEKNYWYYSGSISKENGEFRYAVNADTKVDKCQLPVLFK